MLAGFLMRFEIVRATKLVVVPLANNVWAWMVEFEVLALSAASGLRSSECFQV
jgi:hypothetical protein